MENRLKLNMKNQVTKYLFLTLILLINVAPAFSQRRNNLTRTEPLNRILFIYDASNSMNGMWESGRKNLIAQRLISDALDSLKGKPNVELALRVYGHQFNYLNGQNCDDTKLEVPFSKYNVDKIKNRLKTIKAKGTTPIAKTLEKSEVDFPPCANCRNIIILITDGIEECDGDPCAVSRALQRKGIVLKPFVIGIGMDPDFIKTFECIGTYFDASNEKTFKNALGVVISQALNNTSAQVSLLDAHHLPNETNVNMTFFDMHTEKIIYNFIHALNTKGNPDTLKLEPLHTYRIKVHTIPPVYEDSIIITPGIHNIIGISTPQGFLNIKMNGMLKKPVSVIIRKKGSTETLHIQDINSTEKLLIGKYDLEILSYPRLKINDVQVDQSSTTTIEVPPPGILNIIRSSSGRTDVYKHEKNELNWVYQLAESSQSENLYLLPGNYKIVHKPKSAKGSGFTSEQNVTIKSHSSSTIRF